MIKCPTCGTEQLFEVTAIDPLIKSFEQWINHLEASGLSYAYVSKLKSIVANHIAPNLRDMDVKAVSSKVVFDFYSTLLQRGLASKTIKHILDTLKGLLNHLFYLDVIHKVPKFPKIKITAQSKRWIGIDTQRMILSQIDPQYQLFYAILFETGMRPGEARALKKRDIDGAVITVERALDEKNNTRPTKTGHIYKYQISNDLASYIHINFSHYMPERMMFSLSRSNIQKIWTRACRTVGVSIPMYQASRHSKASQINEQCEQERLCRLKEALQHESATTTTKYYTLGSKEKL
ncbi:tyrosine-type recombinase/integrase [Candidatus Magnetominusculus xianensis]|uniref:Integrase n=1 Tax=Candidatus Magnetominusculus xianensis TaxID=1748249 RepID=A0ABR5SGA0_9BACT|nr:tyrosine-type recombinase/integrase [Candidatus Magnetominusculus xianensis]KWT87650.1 integrase [Candidatus Magnetominusculus xianensis]MBF0405662.1 tyrosine-type recombinase/integrase [Nitrospirota bacterium]